MSQSWLPWPRLGKAEAFHGRSSLSEGHWSQPALKILCNTFIFPQAFSSQGVLLKAESAHAVDCKKEKLNLIHPFFLPAAKEKPLILADLWPRKKMREWHKLHETPKVGGYCLCVRSRKILKWMAPSKRPKSRGRAILPAPLQLAAPSHPHRLGRWLPHAWLELPGFNGVAVGPAQTLLPKWLVPSPSVLQEMGSTDSISSWRHLFPCC